MQEDVEKMAFETHVRALMRDLLEPVIHKGKVDREMIFRLEKQDEGLLKRVDLLEEAVYAKEEETGKTLFDHMEEKLLEMQIHVKGSLKEIGDQVSLTEQEFHGELFKTN